jgi:Zn-dependent protease
MSLLRTEPLTFFLLVIPLLYSVVLHEIAHGVVALWFGDKTAQQAGRLTLNPVPHVDPFGALMLFFVGFGWAKPVPVNYAQLRHSKTAMIAVSLAGCFTNIALAVLCIVLLQFDTVRAHGSLALVLSVAARITILLGAFNLIPIPPLDGSRVVTAFLPPPLQRLSARFERAGFLVIIALLYLGVLSPVARFLEGAIFRAISFFFRIG